MVNFSKKIIVVLCVLFFTFFSTKSVFSLSAPSQIEQVVRSVKESDFDEGKFLEEFRKKRNENKLTLKFPVNEDVKAGVDGMIVDFVLVKDEKTGEDIVKILEFGIIDHSKLVGDDMAETGEAYEKKPFKEISREKYKLLLKEVFGFKGGRDSRLFSDAISNYSESHTKNEAIGEIGNDKALTAFLFDKNKLEKYRPRSKLYFQHDADGFAEEIIGEVSKQQGDNSIVFKSLDMYKGEGMDIVPSKKENVKSVLKERCAQCGKDNMSSSPFFMAEEAVSGHLVRGRRAVGRKVFLLEYDGKGNVYLHILGEGYWKLAKATKSEGERDKSKFKDSFMSYIDPEKPRTAAKISGEHSKIIDAQLKDMFSYIYPDMLNLKRKNYVEELIVSKDKHNIVYALDLCFKSYGEIDISEESLIKLKEYLHEDEFQDFLCEFFKQASKGHYSESDKSLLAFNMKKFFISILQKSDNLDLLQVVVGFLKRYRFAEHIESYRDEKAVEIEKDLNQCLLKLKDKFNRLEHESDKKKALGKICIDLYVELKRYEYECAMEKKFLPGPGYYVFDAASLKEKEISTKKLIFMDFVLSRGCLAFKGKILLDQDKKRRLLDLAHVVDENLKKQLESYLDCSEKVNLEEDKDFDVVFDIVSKKNEEIDTFMLDLINKAA